MSNFVVLVDLNDQELGIEEKLAAHQKGLLHRAFSILLFNSKGEILLQQRAHTKYHSAGLWTNTCCSHPAPMESLEAASKRRLGEELLFSTDQIPELHPLTSFVYRAEMENDLIEYEFDHVLMGRYDVLPSINSDEAVAYRWESLTDIQQAIRSNPDHFTFWFKEIISQFYTQIETHIHESL